MLHAVHPFEPLRVHALLALLVNSAVLRHVERAQVEGTALVLKLEQPRSASSVNFDVDQLS